MNFDINFRMNRTFYIEDEETTEKAIAKAKEHLMNLIHQDPITCFEIEAKKAGE